jgi:hypothetical protein
MTSAIKPATLPLEPSVTPINQQILQGKQQQTATYMGRAYNQKRKLKFH